MDKSTKIQFDVINLSSHPLSVPEQEALTLGLGFCLEQGLDHFEITKDLSLFMRSLLIKVLHHKSTSTESAPETVSRKMSKNEYRALRFYSFGGRIIDGNWIQ